MLNSEPGTRDHEAHYPQASYLLANHLPQRSACSAAILGTAGAVIAGMAWTHSGLTATAGGVPLSDILTLLIGLPLAAAIGAWLFAGREPRAAARQPLD